MSSHIACDIYKLTVKCLYDMLGKYSGSLHWAFVPENSELRTAWFYQASLLPHGRSRQKIRCSGYQSNTLWCFIWQQSSISIYWWKYCLLDRDIQVGELYGSGESGDLLQYCRNTYMTTLLSSWGTSWAGNSGSTRAAIRDTSVLLGTSSLTLTRVL